MSHNRHWPIA
jgi:DNA-binding protein HU-beta